MKSLNNNNKSNNNNKINKLYSHRLLKNKTITSDK